MPPNFLKNFLTFAHRQPGCKGLVGWVEQKGYKIIYSLLFSNLLTLSLYPAYMCLFYLSSCFSAVYSVPWGGK